MDHDFQQSRAYAEHLLAEHRRVQGLLHRIEQRWSVTPAQHPSSTIADLRESVEELRDELARHFAEEEAGGVLEEAVARCPDLGREEIRLKEEHSVLLGELDHIISGMRTATDVGLLPDDLKKAFQCFVATQKSHEAAENRLLERGFGIEIS